MTGTWLDLKFPLDATLERLLRDLDEGLRSKAIPYVLTGGRRHDTNRPKDDWPGRVSRLPVSAEPTESQG